MTARYHALSHVETKNAQRAAQRAAGQATSGLSSQQDCISLALRAYCPNIQPRAHARLTGLTMQCAHAFSGAGPPEFETRIYRQAYPTCCPLVCFSHIASLREHQRCCARRAMRAHGNRQAYLSKRCLGTPGFVGPRAQPGNSKRCNASLYSFSFALVRVSPNQVLTRLHVVG